MSHSIPFKFKQTSGTSKDGGPTIYKAIASTAALDRDREVLLPKGCVTEEFLKNPVMLLIHNYGHVPVGKVHTVDITEEQVSFDFEFSDSEQGKEIEDLYEKGFMNAFSVGFYPLKSQWIDEDGPKSMDLEVVGGTQTFSVEDYKETPRRVINMWELLEISPVPVPSNPEALLIRAKENIVRKFMGAGKHSEAEGQLLEAQINGKMKTLNDNLKSFFTEIDEEISIPKAVPIHSVTIDKELEWDLTGAKGKLSKWASEDSSGLKATVDWGEYVKGFGWVNLDKANTFTAYKFAHHTIKDDEFIAVWKGITEAMSSILGEEGKELDKEERKEVYAHLAAHYADAEKDAPALETEYSDEELLAIADDTYKASVTDEESSTDEESVTDDSESEDQGDKQTDSAQLKSFIKDELKSLNGALSEDIKELEETVRLRLNILLDSVEEVQSLISKMKPESETEISEDVVDTDANDDSKETEVWEKQFANLSSLLENQLTSGSTQ